MRLRRPDASRRGRRCAAGTDAAPVPATEDFDSERNALTAMTGNSEVVPEMALTNADTKVAAPADPEPTRRKRPRRKSRRKAAPRKRRTK